MSIMYVIASLTAAIFYAVVGVSEGNQLNVFSFYALFVPGDCRSRFIERPGTHLQ